MTRNEWVVRTTSFLQGTGIPFSQTEVSLPTRAEARNIMAAQKVLATHAILRTQIELFKVKTVELFAGTSITRFYQKKR